MSLDKNSESFLPVRSARFCILVLSSSEQRTRRRQVLFDFLFLFSLSVFGFILTCLFKASQPMRTKRLRLPSRTNKWGGKRGLWLQTDVLQCYRWNTCTYTMIGFHYLFFLPFENADYPFHYWWLGIPRLEFAPLFYVVSVLFQVLESNAF